MIKIRNWNPENLFEIFKTIDEKYGDSNPAFNIIVTVSSLSNGMV